MDKKEKAITNKKQFKPAEHYIKETAKKVANILTDHFPEYMSFGNGTFTISKGSTQVMINVRHFLKDETVIVCFSNVVRGAKVSTKLMHYLLRKNAELHFGAFALLFDGTITFSHSITGKNLDSNELVTTVSSVAFIADYYDDILVEMAGGKRAKDHFETVKAFDY